MGSLSQLCSDPQTSRSAFFFHFLASGQTPEPIHSSYTMHQMLTYASLLRSSTFVDLENMFSYHTPRTQYTSKTLSLPGTVTCSSVTLLLPNIFPTLYLLKVHISNVRNEYKDLCKYAQDVSLPASCLLKQSLWSSESAPSHWSVNSLEYNTPSSLG